MDSSSNFKLEIRSALPASTAISFPLSNFTNMVMVPSQRRQIEGSSLGSGYSVPVSDGMGGICVVSCVTSCIEGGVGISCFVALDIGSGRTQLQSMDRVCVGACVDA